MAEWTEEITHVAGTDLAIIKGGQGKPLLVLHEELGHPGWLSWHSALAKDHTLIIPIQPGLGKSPKVEWIRNIHELGLFYGWVLRELNLAPIDVIGFSTGGWTAAEMATANSKQLNKLVNVIKIVELDPAQSVQREHLLIKVRVDNSNRSQILEAVTLFRARVVDVATDALVIEVTGDSGKVQALLRVLEPYGIKEIAQSGLLAIGRGGKSITERVFKN